MGALNPLFLLAAATVAVPLFLHLFHRNRARRIVFPALRYLERTEREHARQIRLRQLLLLFLRIVVLLTVVAAGARLFFQGRGSAHPPTAVVVVLDNSMSTSAVVGEERVLDGLKALAIRTLEGATPEDRFWIVRAGEPWLPAVPVGASEARRIILDTEPSAAGADLPAALARAVGLLSASELEAREIHLLSDLQRSAFPDSTRAGREAGAVGDLPLVVWSPREAPPGNRGLVGLEVGGGLPPLEGQRTEITVRTGGPAADAEPEELPVRIWVDGRIRGAASVPAGASVSLALPPAGSGWVQGYAESDPDALRTDDRRYFAYRSRPAPRVAVEGNSGLFVEEAVAVLDSAGRLVTGDLAEADVLLAGSGQGLEVRGPATAAVVVPPADPALLPALNRRLAATGIPWRYQPPEENAAGEAELEGPMLPEALEGIRVRRAYRLALADDPPTPPHTVASLVGRPWAVEGSDDRGRGYLLLASSLDPESTDLPVSAAMVRFMDWASSHWGGQDTRGVESLAGLPLPAPRAATHVRTPADEVLELDGTRLVRETRATGFYTFLAGDSAVGVYAVNPPPAESELERLTPDAVEDRLGAGLVAVDDAGDWPRSVFRTRQGPELWRPLLLLTVLLLMAESLLAATGRSGARKATPASTPGADVQA